MSTFQIGILVLVILVLALIIVKLIINLSDISSKSAPANLPADAEKQNILLDSDKLQEKKNTPHSNHDAKKIEPSINLTNSAKECPLDATIDCISYIKLAHSINGSMVLQKSPIFDIRLNKPIFISGRNSLNDKWELINDKNSYSEIRAGIQLVDLNSIVSQLELSSFIAELKEFSERLDGTLEIPDLEEEIFRIKHFASLVIPANKQLSLTLNIYTADGLWTIDFVRQQAKLLNFVETHNPRLMAFKRRIKTEGDLFNLTFNLAKDAENKDMNKLNKVTLALDFFLVPEHEQPFIAMYTIAMELAKLLNGTIVDNNLTPLPEQQFQLIHKDLQNRYSLLINKGIPAGSALAIRLFG